MKISFTKLPNFKNSNFVFILDIFDHFISFVSLSSLGRGVLLTFLALKKKIFIATYALILYTLSIQLFYFSPNNLSVSTDILVFFLKVILFLSSIILLDVKKNTSNIQGILIFVCIINIIISATGYGYTQYGFSSSGIPYGIKGVYIGGNELSIAYLIGCILIKPKNIYVAICISIIGLTFATKVAIFGSILTLFLYFITNLNTKYFKYLFFLIIPLIAYTSVFYVELQQERWSEDLSKSSSIVNFVFSGRDEKLAVAMESWDTSATEIIIGHGFNNYHNNTIGYNEFFVEVDLIDFFYIGGLLLLSIVYIPIIYKLILAARIKNYRLSFAILAIIGLSVTSGHTLYNTILPLILLNLAGGRTS